MRLVLVAIICVLLGSCSTGYDSAGFTGGYTQKELEPGIWRVSYGGNGFTTAETVQTYWLYRCAELALEKGFTGFEIMSDLRLSDYVSHPVEVQVASSVPIFIPMDGPSKPYIYGDIQLLKGKIVSAPPKIFDAAALKAQLEPIVKGKKCDMGNVCEHVHHYLYPVG